MCKDSGHVVKLLLYPASTSRAMWSMEQTPIISRHDCTQQSIGLKMTGTRVCSSERVCEAHGRQLTVRRESLVRAYIYPKHR